jgi:hypothetical protein
MKSWICPKCGRQFERNGQSHSCKIFTLEKHFEGKEKGKDLYEKLTRAIKKNIGAFKVDPVECCIHLVTRSTFAAVKVLHNKIRVDFTLPYKVKKRRLLPTVQLSANRYLHYVDINDAAEINEELMEWMKEAYEERNVKVV